MNGPFVCEAEVPPTADDFFSTERLSLGEARIATFRGQKAFKRQGRQVKTTKDAKESAFRAGVILAVDASKFSNAEVVLWRESRTTRLHF